MLSFLLTICDEKSQYKVEYLYNTFHADMIRFAKKRLRSIGLPNCEIDAEDVVQNSFLKITKYIDSIKIEAPTEQLKSYMFSSVNNEITNYLNEIKRFSGLNDGIDEHMNELLDEDFVELINLKERYDEVVAAIKKLDDRYSTTLRCRFVDNMDIKDIAELMDLPEKTVYTRISRGKKHLAEMLGVN